MAPFAMERSGSVTISSGSNCCRKPRPEQWPHAPYGLLKREHARLELLQEGAVLGAGESLRVELVDPVVRQPRAHQAVALRQRQLGRLGDARAVLLGDLHAVDHDLDVVLLVALEVGVSIASSSVCTVPSTRTRA
jgi:hypothetical protein